MNEGEDFDSISVPKYFVKSTYRTIFVSTKLFHEILLFKLDFKDKMLYIQPFAFDNY